MKITSTVIKTNKQPKDLSRIVEIKNLDKYGILLLKTEWLEKIQKLSGEDGRFTKEWQFHYWFATTKKKIGNQSIYVAIPLCFYNYEQYVSGAHIDFKLPDVYGAAMDSKNQALEAFNELQKTDLFRMLSNLIGSKWEIHSMSNIHTHPNGINKFSSTDLNKSNDNPGVVYPLLEGQSIPHFTGIQMHIDGKTEIIHNEFRVFTREKDYKIYKYGRCLTISKGFEEEYEEPEKKKETEIDLWFGQKRWQGIPPEKPKSRKDTYLIDNFEDTEEVKNFVVTFLDFLEKTNYEPKYDILQKNIKKKVYTSTSTVYSGHTIYSSSKKKQGNLFGDTEPSYNGMLQELEKLGIEKQYYEKKPYHEVKQFYKKVFNGKITKKDVFKTRDKVEKELIDILLKLDYDIEDMLCMNKKELVEEVEFLTKDNELFGNETVNTDEQEIDFIKDLLVNELVITKKDAGKMSDEELFAAYDKYFDETSIYER